MSITRLLTCCFDCSLAHCRRTPLRLTMRRARQRVSAVVVLTTWYSLADHSSIASPYVGPMCHLIVRHCPRNALRRGLLRDGFDSFSPGLSAEADTPHHGRAGRHERFHVTADRARLD